MRILNNQYIRNISVLASGTVIAQVIGFFTYPILTRIYSPENFATYGFFLAICVFKFISRPNLE